MTEVRFQLSNGIIIGVGIGFVLIGFLGWLSVSSISGTLKEFFLANGYDPNRYYLFRSLTNLTAIYLTVIVTGAAVLLLGALILKSRVVRELFSNTGPHARLGNGLIGGAGAFAFTSMYSLIHYILASDYLQLEFFIVYFLLGVFLFACGILVSRHK